VAGIGAASDVCSSAALVRARGDGGPITATSPSRKTQAAPDAFGDCTSSHRAGAVRADRSRNCDDRGRFLLNIGFVVSAGGDGRA